MSLLWQGKLDLLFQIVVKERYAFNWDACLSELQEDGYRAGRFEGSLDLTWDDSWRVGSKVNLT